MVAVVDEPLVVTSVDVPVDVPVVAGPAEVDDPELSVPVCAPLDDEDGSVTLASLPLSGPLLHERTSGTTRAMRAYVIP